MAPPCPAPPATSPLWLLPKPFALLDDWRTKASLALPSPRAISPASGHRAPPSGRPRPEQEAGRRRVWRGRRLVRARGRLPAPERYGLELARLSVPTPTPAISWSHLASVQSPRAAVATTPPRAGSRAILVTGGPRAQRRWDQPPWVPFLGGAAVVRWSRHGQDGEIRPRGGSRTLRGIECDRNQDRCGRRQVEPFFF
jgi:hypothetical protein